MPTAYSTRLHPLFQECNTDSPDAVRRIIREETGKDVNQIFASFSDIPIASASLAQVHEATLHSGQRVAVKVQHEHIQFQVPGDVNMIKRGTKAAKYFFPEFEYEWFGEEVEKNLPNEIDFRNEVKNIKKMQQVFKDDEAVVYVYKKYSGGF